MAKLIVSIFLTALLSFVCGLFLPWWTIALAAFVVSLLIPQRPLFAFFSGFFAILLLWGAMAVVIDQLNQSILSAKVAAILPLGGSAYLLIFVTALVGALVGGGAAITASFLTAKPVTEE